MKYLNRNNELIELLYDKLSLTSSKVDRINILKEDAVLNIEIDFELFTLKDNFIRLKFIDILEYSFYYNSDYIFYNVETVKLINTERGIYLSLDPYDEDGSISSNDQDYILCKEIEGFIL